MKIAKVNCKIIPQITLRHGNRLRLLDNNHAHASITTSPKALISWSGIRSIASRRPVYDHGRVITATRDD
jgi:hypothetical protein